MASKTKSKTDEVVTSVSLASSISKFSGEENENIKFFINNINQLANLENWSEQKKVIILKLHLAGKALQYISNNENSSNSESFEELETILTKKFSKKTKFADILHKFSNLQQKQNQSVDNLVEQVSNITDSYVDLKQDSSQETVKLAEKLKAQKLIDALRTEIKVDILKMGLTDFKDIAKAAKNIETALNSQELICNNMSKSTEIELILKNQIENNKAIQDLTKKLEESQSRQINNLQASTSRGTGVQRYPQRNNRNNVYCHICNKSHLTTKCWYYPNNRGNRGRSSNFRTGWRTSRGNRPYRPYYNRHSNNRDHQNLNG